MSAVTKLLTPGGGGVNITPASSIASDVTVQVPSQNCTLGIQGPAFRAYGNGSQSVSNATFTKISLQNESFDTNNNFDSASNYRFTPTVAGYYQITGVVAFTGSANNTAGAYLYKNGSLYTQGSSTPNNTNLGACVNVSDTIYFNGSTDYVELYGWQNSGGALNTQNYSYSNVLSGCLVRSA